MAVTKPNHHPFPQARQLGGDDSMIQKAGTQSCIYNTSATLEKKTLRKNVQKDIHPHGNNSCLCDKITECVRLLFAFSTPSGMDRHYLYHERSSRVLICRPSRAYQLDLERRATGALARWAGHHTASCTMLPTSRPREEAHPAATPILSC